MIERKHIGVYGIIIKDDSVVLIDKVGGPYNGKLDLPGGSFKFGETPSMVLIRELKEEVGIDVKKIELIDADSIMHSYTHKNNQEILHHIGIIYKILEYENDILESIEIDNCNDDSKGAKFYKIEELKKDNLSKLAILILENLGYELK